MAAASMHSTLTTAPPPQTTIANAPLPPSNPNALAPSNPNPPVQSPLPSSVKAVAEEESIRRKAQQRPSKIPRHLKSMMEDVDVMQWKNLARNLHPITKIGHLGRVGYREIGMHLESQAPRSIAYGLGALQALAHEPGVPLPAQADFEMLVKALVRLYKSKAAELQRQFSSNSIFTDLWKEILEDSANLLERRPPTEEPSLGMISNILRGWVLSGQPMALTVLGEFEGFLSDCLFGSGGKTYESQKNLLLLLDSLAGHRGLARETVKALFSYAQGEMESIARALESSPVRLEVGVAVDQAYLEATSANQTTVDEDLAESEAIKKTIIGYIGSCGSLWKAIPGHTFVLLNLLCKASCILESVQSERLFLAVYRFARIFFTPMARLVGLIERLFARPSFLRSADAARWMEMVIFNCGFGLPDGGYLELALLILEQLLMKGSMIKFGSEEEEEEERRIVAEMLCFANSLRRLWYNCSSIATDMPTTNQALKQRKIVLSHQPPQCRVFDFGNGSKHSFEQQVFSNTSHPYLVLMRLLGVLDGMSRRKRDIISNSMQMMIIEWISQPPPSAKAAHLVHNERVLGILERLLN